VALRAITPDDGPALRQILATEAVARWWHERDADWPLDEDPDTVKLAIVLDGSVIGLIQYGEELDPDYRHAAVDLFIRPDLHNRGLGTDAMMTLSRHLMDGLGHHRLTIDPAADNSAAIRCYEKAGFRRVGVMERYWRDRRTGDWRDGLLMELVRAPSASPGSPS
jgi:aminoglycoside 6'-N-acetyltransferase